MRKILLLVAVLGLSACGKKGDEPKGDCTASVTNAVNLSAEEYKKSGVTEATVAKIRESSVVRCNEDKWTNEVLKCLADAKQADDVAKCQQMMSKEQNDNMAKAIAGAMGTQPDQGSDAEPDGSAGSGSAGSGSAAETPAGLPPECVEYKSLVDKLATCEKLPQASRDMLTKTFDDTSKAWEDIDKLPADAKAALAGGCKQGADALKQSAGAACGF
jgi:hypothetical protein